MFQGSGGMRTTACATGTRPDDATNSPEAFAADRYSKWVRP